MPRFHGADSTGASIATDPRSAPAPIGNLSEIVASVGSIEGLTSAEAAARLARTGPNRMQDDTGSHPLAILMRQVSSPLVLILLVAAGLSLALKETTEAMLVIAIVAASAGLGFFQEFRAAGAVAALRRRLSVSTTVVRDGKEQQLPLPDIVPGDLVRLGAGSMVPADAVLVDSDELQVDEAALTGESFPVAKAAAAPDKPPGEAGQVFMGTSVRSGTAHALVLVTGRGTRFGRIGAAVARLEPETGFGRGIRQFGLLMSRVMLVLVTLVLALNVVLGRPPIDSLLFAAALAVGMTPELLPAIVTVTLARGARALARSGVLVRRLVAIENLGAMDLLCTDKTGTLTQGLVRLGEATDAGGTPSRSTLTWAALNAGLQAGPPNPLDLAVIEAGSGLDLAAYRRLAEVPYDFDRRRISVLVAGPDGPLLICKGAVAELLPICTTLLEGDGTAEMTEARREAELQRLAAWSAEGFRVLAVATRPLPGRGDCGAGDEAGLALAGYLVFADPLKPGIGETVAALARKGVGLRIITGDNRFVAGHVAESIGLRTARIVIGADLATLNDRALARRVAHADVFAEVTPDQKERIIAAFRRLRHTVGFLGDGINDAPALRAADVGISVDTAVDAAKAAADVVLLERDLDVLLEGVIIGRTAFANTLKYIRITISANLGNMVSMAVASLLLPFLPMLPVQILLNNLLTDLPMLAISGDRVDPTLLAKPQRWDFRNLVRAMIAFGLTSSAFDAITFAVLLLLFHSGVASFQTGWFIESLLSELAVLAVLRTRGPWYQSRASAGLILVSALVAVVSLALPYTPLSGAVGFTPLPPALLATILAVVGCYVAATEAIKLAMR